MARAEKGENTNHQYLEKTNADPQAAKGEDYEEVRREQLSPVCDQSERKQVEILSRQSSHDHLLIWKWYFTASVNSSVNRPIGKDLVNNDSFNRLNVSFKSSTHDSTHRQMFMYNAIDVQLTR